MLSTLLNCRVLGIDHSMTKCNALVVVDEQLDLLPTLLHVCHDNRRIDILSPFPLMVGRLRCIESIDLRVGKGTHAISSFYCQLHSHLSALGMLGFFQSFSFIPPLDGILRGE